MVNRHVTSALEAFAKSMPNMFSKETDKTKPALDFGTKLREMHGLGEIPTECWPCNAVVVDMMKEGEKQRKNGVSKPFVYMDLAKCTPLGCMHDTELLSTFEDEYDECTPLQDAMSKALGLPEKGKKTSAGVMFIGQWHNTYDAYALAAAVTGQWSLAASWAHKTLICKIATDPALDRRGGRVAVTYDRLYRTRMAAKVAAKAPGFEQNTIAMAPDRELLDTAKNMNGEGPLGRNQTYGPQQQQPPNGASKEWSVGWQGQQNGRNNESGSAGKAQYGQQTTYASKWEQKGLPWIKKQENGGREDNKRNYETSHSAGSNYNAKRHR